ncbi:MULTISPECIES: TetR/AcrR family transcriptional regulator [unclassified Caballeronia]|uniref:TetR/AcrR family transcriptional regulator n=1 Tax=unclassified Caballeronia TaxID=2646786 RepID=UPI00285AB735|nr:MULTISPECIES: TetR/AcrR family transcriptional regulator [unclassified Caballeronia]MDR5755020.1 TetR/AcrR family transcriptional regulator [Caballeronia sp. LZ024]MDR5845582.1 TetR/AcrR family transcriptional regulator [Caballeronia sp. LZ031]
MSPKSSIAKNADYHHGNLRTALIEAGRRALMELSAQDLSLRYLARMVGVSEAAPSRHFSGIDELLATIAASGYRDLAALRVAIRDSEDTALGKAYRMMRVYVEFAQRHNGLFGLMIGPRIVAHQAYPELAEESNRSFGLFSETIEALAIESGWARSDLKLVTHAAWSVEHGLATLLLANRAPRADTKVAIPRLIDFVLAALLGAITAGPDHLQNVMQQCALLQKPVVARTVRKRAKA